MNAEENDAGLIALQGGEVVSRTRLHKQVYRMDPCGTGFGLGFIVTMDRIPLISSAVASLHKRMAD